MTALRINGAAHTVDADPNMPLLWVLRDLLGLVGTKYGCGIGTCGTCTVHVNGEAKPSCMVTLNDAAGKDITTIEGLPETHPVLRAWVQVSVPLCGYCTPGQIMHAAALLRQKPNPEQAEVVKAMSAVLCRCGTYSRAFAAMRLAAKMSK
jgi:isoquinoline 1-oxidoreductase alpha subunit